MRTFVHVHRLESGDEEAQQSRGVLRVYVDGRLALSCVVLEPQQGANDRDKGCIGLGQFTLTHVVSKTFGKILAVGDTPGRDLIRIHAGNYRKDTRGCLLPGASWTDLDLDGRRDVTNSRKTLDQIRALVPTAGCPLLVTADATWNA